MIVVLILYEVLRGREMKNKYYKVKEFSLDYVVAISSYRFAHRLSHMEFLVTVIPQFPR